jgi:hypothetical protein
MNEARAYAEVSASGIMIILKLCLGFSSSYKEKMPARCVDVAPLWHEVCIAEVLYQDGHCNGLVG